MTEKCTLSETGNNAVCSTSLPALNITYRQARTTTYDTCGDKIVLGNVVAKSQHKVCGDWAAIYTSMDLIVKYQPAGSQQSHRLKGHS